jgi:hypothetical protein
MTSAVVQDHLDTFCLRCGRSLRSPSSVTRGYGPMCAGYIREARETTDLTGFHTWQADKASQLIETCGLVPAGLPEVYHSVSSDGSTVYLSSRESCTCKAGRNRVPCYHRAGVAILQATRARRRPRQTARRVA